MFQSKLLTCVYCGAKLGDAEKTFPVKKARMAIFGNPTTCKCGFHPVNVSVKAIILNYVDKKSAN